MWRWEFPFGFGETFEGWSASLIFSKNVKINSLASNSQRVFDKAFHLLERYQEFPFEKLLTHKFYSLEELMPYHAEDAGCRLYQRCYDLKIRSEGGASDMRTLHFGMYEQT